MTPTRPVCALCGRTLLESTKTSCPYYALVHCANCNHFSVASEEIAGKSNELVQLEYFGEQFAVKGGFFARLYEILNCRRIFESLQIHERARILEIGPGSGALLAYLYARNHDVVGLDISSAVVSAIKRKFGLPVECESVERHLMHVGPERYDLIILCHVLEHFSDPLSELRTLFKMLKVAGKIYIAVPNMDSWHARWSGWTGYEPYHLHYFTRASLEATLLRAGFSVLRRRSYESLSGWPNTIFRTMLRSRKSATPAPSEMAPINSWRRAFLEVVRLGVGIVISPFRWIQASVSRGEELVVLAKRNEQ